jgi:hypothetical protein
MFLPPLICFIFFPLCCSVEKRVRATGDEEFDADELAKLNAEQENEIELIREVSNAMNVCLNYYAENFLPYFNMLLPFFHRMIVGGKRKKKEKKKEGRKEK